MNIMAGRKRHSAEDIVRKLRRADELAAEGRSGEQIAAELGVSVATPYNWRRAYGGMDIYSDPKLPCPYGRNPLGRGFVIANTKRAVDNLELPNLEWWRRLFLLHRTAQHSPHQQGHGQRLDESFRARVRGRPLSGRYPALILARSRTSGSRDCSVSSPKRYVPTCCFSPRILGTWSGSMPRSSSSVIRKKLPADFAMRVPESISRPPCIQMLTTW